MTADPTLIQPEPTSKRRRWLWPVVAATALFVGIGIGGASGSDPPAADPEVRTVTETETVTVETVPDVCLAALDDADGLMTISAEFATQTSTAMGIAQDAVLAAGSFDIAGLTDATDRLLVVNEDIGALTGQVQGSTYAVNRDSCRAAG